MKRFVSLCLFGLIALTLAACAAATPTQPPAQNADPTLAPPSETSGGEEGYPAQVDSSDPSGYPQPESRQEINPAYPSPNSLGPATGIAAVDQALAALQSGDPAAWRSLLRYTTAACTAAEGAGGPPRCAEGEAEGTQVEGLPVLGPEGYYLRLAEVADDFLAGPFSLTAIYYVKADAVQDALYPAGIYGVVVDRANADGSRQYVTLRLDDSGIVRVDFDRDVPGNPFGDAGNMIYSVQ